MIQPPSTELPPIERLRTIMATLRSPEGCPWDREQSLDSLKPYLLEEAHEVIEAIDSGDPAAHCDELGDLLLQVVFQSQLTSEEGGFTFDDVATAISEKLIRRHPHVYGDTTADTPDEVLKNWNEIKQQEKGNPTPASALDGINQGLPALLKAQELQKKAAKVGFDWPDVSGAAAKLDEELAEYKAATSPDEQIAELADLVFAAVNTIRHLGGHAELAVTRSANKFRDRFLDVERLAQERGIDMASADLETLDAIWDDVKAQRGGA